MKKKNIKEKDAEQEATKIPKQGDEGQESHQKH